MTDLIVSAAVGGSALAAIPAAIGVTTLWHRLVDFLDAHTDRPGTDPIGGRQQLAITAAPEPSEPIAALAAVPYELVDDEHFGVLPIGPLAPAHLFDEDRYAALIGAAA